MLSTQEKNLRRKVQGFTLTEIAIVLGIIGLILGAIWVAASGVYSSQRTADSNKDLLTVTQAIRALYATQTQVDTANGTDETTALIRSGVFPTDMLNTGNAATATTVKASWSGSTVKVFSAQAASTGDSFEVMFVGVPQQACINLLTASTGTSRDQGMIHAQGRTSVGTYLATPGTLVTTYNVASATTSCASTTSNDVIYIFSLRG